MYDPRWDDPRERDDGPARVYDDRDRPDHDLRDGLMHDLDLPRGEARELVIDRDHMYELNGEDSRTLAAVGAFRVVPEQDLDIDHNTLGHLRAEGLVEAVNLGGDERGVVLTKEGRDLLVPTPWSATTKPRRRSTPASAGPAKSTTIRTSMRRIGRRRHASETSTAASTSGASSSSRT